MYIPNAPKAYEGNASRCLGRSAVDLMQNVSSFYKITVAAKRDKRER